MPAPRCQPASVAFRLARAAFLASAFARNPAAFSDTGPDLLKHPRRIIKRETLELPHIWINSRKGEPS